MADNTAPIFLPVLPSFKGFGPALAKGAAADATKQGGAVGAKFGKAIAVGVAGTVAGVGAAGMALYKVGEVFDDVTDTIRVGSGASGAALDGLVDSAKNVGTKVPADFDKIGTTVADLSTRMGLSGGTLEKVASQYLEAGRILGEDVDVTKTSAAFNAFKIEGDDVSGAMDHLFQVSQATGVGMNELADAAARNAPAMSILGFSFEETTAMVGSFDKAGLNSSAIMASMSKGLVTLAKDGEEPATAFKRVQSEIGGFVAAGDTAAALDLASKVFGTKGATQFVGALESGALSMDDMSKAAGQTDDTILGLGQETMDFAEQWQLFKNNVLVWLEPMGARVFGALGTLMGEVTTGVAAFGDAWKSNDGTITASGIPGMFERLGFWARRAFDSLKSVGQWMGENQPIVRAVAAVIGAVLIPVLVGLGVSATVSAAKQAAAWIVAKAGAVRAGIVYVAQAAIMVGRWVFMGAQALLQAGRMAAAWVIAMGPVGWVIAAVVGLAVLVIANWDKIKTWTINAWSAITEWVAGAWRNMKETVSAGVNFIKSWVVTKITELQARWNAVWSYIKAYVAAVWSGVKNLVAAGVNYVKDWVVRKITELQTQWVAIWNYIKAAVAAVWSGIKSLVGLAIDWVRTRISNTLEAIKSIWSAGWDWVKTKVSNVWSGIKTLISNAWGVVKGTLQTMIDFVRTKPGEAFTAAKNAIGDAWDKIKAKVKTPIRAVIGFINDGLIDKFNVIPGVNIPKLKLPEGFRKGGYTGDGRADEVAGPVHRGEYVFTKAQTAAIGKENLAAQAHAAVRGKPQAAVGSGVYGGIPSFYGPQFQEIDRANAVQIRGDAQARSYWYMNQAAQMWNGLANVRLSTGGIKDGATNTPVIFAQEQGDIYGQLRGMPNWAGFYSNRAIRMNPAARWMSPRDRRTAMAHEIGHALGLPHAMQTGARSIMNYNTMYGDGRVMPADASALRSIYGAPGSGNTASSVMDIPEEKSNPFSNLVDILMGKIKEAFPSAGMFVDMAGGIAKQAIGQVVKVVEDIKNGIKKIAGDVFGKIKGFFGGGNDAEGAKAPLFRDQGGILPPGLSTVLNNTGGNEYVLNRQQWSDIHGLAAQGGAGGQFEGNLYLDSGEFMGKVHGAVTHKVNQMAGTATTRRAGY